MGREDRQGRSKKQLKFSENVAAVSFLVLFTSIMVYYFYQLIMM